MRRAFDQLVADREVNEGIALFVHDPEDVGVLEENRGVLGVDLLVIAELVDIRRDRPDWRQEMENRLGSSERPSEPPSPPVRAWLIWQATPGTFGSSNALTQTLSLRPSSRNVVLTQAISSASAADADRMRCRRQVQFAYFPSFLGRRLQSLAQPLQLLRPGGQAEAQGAAVLERPREDAFAGEMGEQRSA